MQHNFDILSDLDKTLDNLITNAEAMSSAALSSWEKENFEKIQESLLSHLLFLDERLQTKHPRYKTRKGLQEKVLHFKKINLGTSLQKKNPVRISKARLEKRTFSKKTSL
ncbi:MAG: hypothetical protein WCP39_04420 [Chlamydiota bacterium]